MWWKVRAAPYLYQISFFNLNTARYAKCLNANQQPFVSIYSDLYECDLAWWLASSLVAGVNLNYKCDPLSVRGALSMILSFVHLTESFYLHVQFYEFYEIDLLLTRTETLYFSFTYKI